MLDILLIVAGAIVVVLVFIDALATTLAVSSGAGPLTSAVLGALWRVVLRLHREDKPSGLLTMSGPAMLMTTVLTWVAALWTGWSLVFYGSDAVVTSQAARPASVADVVYFTGLTIFTLGTGDFVASTSAWRIVMAGAAFSGLFLVTLAITYLLSVISAVVARRVIAVQIHGLGDTPSAILARGWTGAEFGSMYQQQLISLSSSVAHSAEQHLAYPVLHYFHSSTRGLAAPIAIANLDEALTIIQAMEPRLRPEASVVDPLRSAIGRYVSTASNTTWAPDVGVPPLPATSEATDAGIPVDQAAVHDVAGRESERRKSLHRLVASDGWSWHGDGEPPHSSDHASEEPP